MQWNKAARCVEILVFLGFHPVPQGKELGSNYQASIKVKLNVSPTDEAGTHHNGVENLNYNRISYINIYPPYDV